MKTIKVKNSYEVPENFTGIAEYSDGLKEWYKEGKLHRENGPAIERADGTKYWYKEGKYHRLDGPAIEYADGSKYWYKEGKYHRLDGPAEESSRGRRYWWIEGDFYDNISLNEYVVLDYDKGPYGLMWYKLLDEEEIIDYPDIPGLIQK